MSRCGFSEIQGLLRLTQSCIEARTGKELEWPWVTLWSFRKVSTYSPFWKRVLYGFNVWGYFHPCVEAFSRVTVFVLLEVESIAWFCNKPWYLQLGELADVGFLWAASPRCLQQHHQKHALLKWAPGFKSAFFFCVFMKFTWNGHCCC